MTGFRDENHLAGTRVISRGQTKLSFKLRLLALVLALILTWYSLNPSLKPTNGIIRDVQAPDEQKRNVEPYSMPATLPVVFRPIGETAESLLSPDEDEDDFEWPEFING